jgi:ATP-dependent exoDNAse (exonuclease V) alpha subunit
MATSPQHISLRVPWHDNMWNGSVCKAPAQNTACLKLHGIAESKDEKRETKNQGKAFWELDEDDLPPCLTDRGGFMSPREFTKVRSHPYANPYSKTHAHFAPTVMRFPPWSAPGVPFRWMRKDDESRERLARVCPDLDVDLDREPELNFETGWWQDQSNHRAILEAFWRDVRPEQSLVFLYAKEIPLVEETGGRRILIGAARVKALSPLQEYDYTERKKDALRSMLWERHVQHSLRPDGDDGFLLPYHAALDHAAEHDDFDPASVVAFAPDEGWEQFSFGTEHVTADIAIAALLACADALRNAKAAGVAGRHDTALKWIDIELGRLWKLRGPFPGLGAVLSGMGLDLGHSIAWTLTEKVGEKGDVWDHVDQMFASPANLLPAHLAKSVGGTVAKGWAKLPARRRAVHQLLARFAMEDEVTAVLLDPLRREEEGIVLEDDELLANPYRIYTATRLGLLSVAPAVIDRGLLPPASIEKRSPVPAPSKLEGPLDERRVAAWMTRVLESAGAAEGHTLLPEKEMLRRIRALPLDPLCEPTSDLLPVVEEHPAFADRLVLAEMADGGKAYQIKRLTKVRDYIASTIEKRVKRGKRHEVGADWGRLLDKALPSMPASDAVEQRARQEKAAALKELAESRLSVLSGPAGTGKTTLLTVLCKHPAIQGGGILMLAPTGKARVRMETAAREKQLTGFIAFTIARHLSATGRYDGTTGRYFMREEEDISPAKTVIIDECSMLTEEMLAATLESIKGVERLILVGDPMQLPPIGAGRPFADIVAKLTPENVESLFPKVGAGFAELTVLRRHQGERADVQLASWFAARPMAPGEDEVFSVLTGQSTSEHLRVETWRTPEELDELIAQTIRRELSLPDGDAAIAAFDLKLGAVQTEQGYINFSYGVNADAAESWQILSPVRQRPWGVDEVNQLIHRHFRQKELKDARLPKKWRVKPQPHGPQQIVYGDKVICVQNQFRTRKYDVWPKEDALEYIANGEIGRVTGRCGPKGSNPWQLDVNFSSQPAHRYTFTADRDFNEEKSATLELAYALTVHKSQGSEFGIVILILPRGRLHLSREMLYTALTRQKDRVVLLCQDSPLELQKLSHPRYSATARRLTNLFRAPEMALLGEDGGFLEKNLIHQTARGEAVRSKSEVIVADALHAKKLAYEYERPLTFEGETRYPDFTIVDDDLGQTFYWEHLGMLWNERYRERWESKIEWYAKHGIKPFENGGGPNGTLITSQDDEKGGISSAMIRALISKVFG